MVSINKTTIKAHEVTMILRFFLEHQPLRVIRTVEQPLYVDAGVKDTLKFNADSSGLVKDVMRSSDSVYIKINGVWEFAFIDSVGMVAAVEEVLNMLHKVGGLR